MYLIYLETSIFELNIFVTQIEISLNIFKDIFNWFGYITKSIFRYRYIQFNNLSPGSLIFKKNRLYAISRNVWKITPTKWIGISLKKMLSLQGSTLTVVRLGIPSSLCCRTTWTSVYGCPLVKLRKFQNQILIETNDSTILQGMACELLFSVYFQNTKW